MNRATDFRIECENCGAHDEAWYTKGYVVVCLRCEQPR